MAIVFNLLLPDQGVATSPRPIHAGRPGVTGNLSSRWFKFPVWPLASPAAFAA
jgi:hypothetical protein